MIRRIRFGDFELDLGSAELERQGVRTRLQELPFKVLRELTARPGEVVTREELFATLWPKGTVIDFDTGLNTAVRKLRAALGDEAATARYIETLPRRGYRLICDVEPVDAATAASQAETAGDPPMQPLMTPRRRSPAWIVIGAVVAAVATTATLLAYRTDATAGRLAAAPDAVASLPARSIAVLPFENLADQQDAAFLASGISESILHQLATLSEVKVIARGSSFSARARAADAQAAGKLLGARYLLTGNVQRQGEALRVIATLTDSEANEQVWSARFDRTLTDVFALQDEIANQVARVLKVSLNATSAARLSARGTSNIEAYLEYLQGRGLVATYRIEDLEQAASHYKRAIELDPQFAAAYSGLAQARLRTLEFRMDDDWVRRRDSLHREARQLADRSLALDASNAEAYLVLASMERTRAGAETYNGKAVELSPNSARAHFGLALTAGWAATSSDPQRADEMFEHIDRAIALDPLEPEYPSAKARGLWAMRTDRLDEADALLQRALEIDPRYFPALVFQAEQRWCCQRRPVEGILLAERALAIDPTSSGTVLLLIHMYLSLGDHAAAAQLQQQYARNSDGLGALLSHAGSWAQAAQIMYDENTRGSLASAPSHVPLFLAVRMHAYETGDFMRARALLEAMADLRGLDESGELIPKLGTDFAAAVYYGEMLLRTGERQRGQRILEAALRAMERASSEFRRGDMWLPFPRAQALALLGSNGEALASIERAPYTGTTNRIWELEIDPVFDTLRSEPRFQAVLADHQRYLAAQRTRLEALRTQGLVPRRGNTATSPD